LAERFRPWITWDRTIFESTALIERARTEAPSEIILALGADVEGEATGNYIAGLLRELSGQSFAPCPRPSLPAADSITPMN
jgi:recombinational DNA repair protein RecR